MTKYAAVLAYLFVGSLVGCGDDADGSEGDGGGLHPGGSTGVAGSAPAASGGNAGGVPTGNGGGAASSGTAGAGVAGVAGTTGSGGVPETSAGGQAGSGGVAGTGLGGAAGRGGNASGGNAGTGGALGGMAGAGGNGSSSCDATPVTPNAIPAVRNVLCYLYSLKGKNTLSGVQDCSWSAADDIGYVNATVGVYPAVIGGDFLYNDAVPTATAAWNAGSLPMIRFHMGRPEDADSYESSLATTDLAATLTPGSSRYTGLMKKLDHAVSELLRLQAAGVVVLWAPFHEAQPNGWFWWSKGSGEQYRQLWKLMFDYFAQKGVRNTIWLMPFSGSPSSSFYPGRAMVDFAGPDTYANSQPFASNYRAAVDAIGSSTMPIALHETGYVPMPADMFSNNQAPFVLFSIWCNDWLQDKSKNSVDELKAAFTHERTINRGELPKF